MDATSTDPAAAMVADLPDLLPGSEAAYKDVHAHPELSMAKTRTAGIAAKHLEGCGFKVTRPRRRAVLPSHRVDAVSDRFRSPADAALFGVPLPLSRAAINLEIGIVPSSGRIDRHRLRTLRPHGNAL